MGKHLHAQTSAWPRKLEIEASGKDTRAPQAVLVTNREVQLRWGIWSLAEKEKPSQPSSINRRHPAPRGGSRAGNKSESSWAGGGLCDEGC